MKRILFIILLILGLLPGLSFGAGTVTESITYSQNPAIKIISLAWVADGSGNLSVSTTAATTAEMEGHFLYEVTTTPGDVSPTSLYDVSINTSLGLDIMGTALLNRSNTVSERVKPLMYTSWPGEAMVTGALTLVITNNSQAAATGTIRLYLRR